MKVWTITNQKGGVGKTTSTITLAGLLATSGYRTLMVDLDPHASLTCYFGIDPDAVEYSVFTLFQEIESGIKVDPTMIIADTKYADLKVLPAITALATLDRKAGHLQGLGLVLSAALQKLSNQFDFVLIDTPPLLGVLMVNALAACQHLIIPVQTEFLALKGLERMVSTLTMILKARKKPLPYTIVPTMFDRRTRASVDSLRILRESYGDHMWSSVIPVDTRFRDASRVGVPLSLYEPKAKGVGAYASLIAFLEEGKSKD